MAKKFDVIAGGGKYTAADGQEKTRWINIGVVLETSKGLRLKLEAVPVGWDGWAMLAEPRERQEKPSGAPEKPKSAFDDMKDDLPF